MCLCGGEKNLEDEVLRICDTRSLFLRYFAPQQKDNAVTMFVVELVDDGIGKLLPSYFWIVGITVGKRVDRVDR